MILNFKIFSTVFILLFCNICFAQTDSLNLALKNLPAGEAYDTTKLVLLVSLGEVCEVSEIEKYAKPALELADKLLGRNGSSSEKIRKRLLNQKAKAFNQMGFVYHQQSEFDKALDYHNKSLKIQEETGDKMGIASSLNYIGVIHNSRGNNHEALEAYGRSLKILEEIGYKNGIAELLNNIGLIHKNQGDITKALDYYSRSLKTMEEVGDKKLIADLVNNIGFIYKSQSDIPNALLSFKRSLKLYGEIGYKYGVANSLNNIGIIYNSNGDVSTAIDHYIRSLKMREEIGDKRGIAESLHNIGFVYVGQHDISKALEYFQRSLKMRKDISDKHGAAMTLINMAHIYYEQKKYSLARAYSDSSVAISQTLGYPENIRNAEQLLSKIDSAGGNYKTAFEHYKQYIIYRDSISNKETRKASIKNQLKYEFEKKEAVIKEQQEKERAVVDEKNRRQQIAIWLVIGGLLMVIVFSAFVFRSLKTVRGQKIIIEEKQKDILDSIHYAKRIQASLLPTEKYIEKILTKLNLK